MTRLSTRSTTLFAPILGFVFAGVLAAVEFRHYVTFFDFIFEDDWLSFAAILLKRFLLKGNEHLVSRLDRPSPVRLQLPEQAGPELVQAQGVFAVLAEQPDRCIRPGIRSFRHLAFR